MADGNDSNDDGYLLGPPDEGVLEAAVSAPANDVSSDDESMEEEEREAVEAAMHRAMLQLAMQQQAKHLKKMADAVRHHWVRYEFAPGRGQIHAHLLVEQNERQQIEEGEKGEREDGRG